MISIITRIQIEGNDTVSFLNGTNYVQGMSQIMPQVPTYISYGYDSISITQDGSKTFQFSVYTVTDVGGNSFTALNFQDPSDVVQAKTIEIYRLLVTAIFKGCCECGSMGPECAIQYTYEEDSGSLSLGLFSMTTGPERIYFDYTTGNNQDFTNFFPIIQDGSWAFIFSKTDPTTYAVIQLSNFSDGGTFARFNYALLDGNGLPFVSGTQFCIDFTSVGGSLVQDWQDTLIIGSTLTQDNTVDGGGYDFVFDNNNSFAINAGGGSVEVDAVGASLNGGTNQVLVTPSYIDIITPGIGGASTGWVLSLTAAGHVEYVEAGTGTISSIGLFMPPAFTVSTPNPLTSNGEFTVDGAGTDLEYINGLGELATLPVYTVENGLHAFGGVPGETPPDPFLFHLGGELVEDTVITTTNGTTEYVLGVAGTADQNTRRPLSVTNLGDGGVAVFSDYGDGTRPNPSVEMITDNDLSQPILNLHMQGDLPDANNTMLRLRYSGRPDLALTTIDYQFRNNNAVAANSNFIGSRLSTEVVSFVDNNEETRFELQLIEGGALANKLEVQGYGQLVLNEYGLNVFSNGVSNIDNDLEYVLAVDSSGNVYKKISEGGGTVMEIDATGLLTTSPDPITTTGTVTSEMNSGFLVGRYDTGLGVFQEITVGAGLDLSAAGVLTADGSVPVYTVDNGLSPDPGDAYNFQLGGKLIKNTTVDGQASWPLSFIKIAEFTVGSVLNSTIASLQNNYIQAELNNDITAKGNNNITSQASTNVTSAVSTAIRSDSSYSNYVPSTGVGATVNVTHDMLAGYNYVRTKDTSGGGDTFNEIYMKSTNGGSRHMVFNSHTNGRAAGIFLGIAADFSSSIPTMKVGTPNVDNGSALVGQVLTLKSMSGNDKGRVEFEDAGGGGTYNGDQGVYKDTSLTPETFMLGAPSGSQGTIPFTIDRYISVAGRRLQMEGTADVLKLIEGTAALATRSSTLEVTAENNYRAAQFTAVNTEAVRISTYGNVGGLFVENLASNTSYNSNFSNEYGGGLDVKSKTDSRFWIYQASPNSINNVIDIQSVPSAGPYTAGQGTSITFQPGVDLGNNTIANGTVLSSVFSDVTASAAVVDFRIDTFNAGSPLIHSTFIGDGQLRLHEYGQTPANFPDASPVWALGVDASGNVVEFTPSGGGTTYTVDNGLSPQTLPTANPDNFQLGGPLVLDTNIDGASTHNLSFTNIKSLTGTAQDVYLGGSDGVNIGSLGLTSLIAALEFTDGTTGTTSVLELSNAYSRFKHIDGTTSSASAIELTGTELRVQTPLYASKTAGDVLTLLDPVTGESEWSTPTGGGGIPFGQASSTIAFPDDYTATIGTATTYTDGDAYLVRFLTGNTSEATLDINGIGVRTLYRNNDGALIGGDIWDGGEMLVVYNAAINGFDCIGTSPNSLFAYVTNDQGSTITRGQAVYAFGGTGNRMTVKLALANADDTSAQTLGFVYSTSIADNQKGIIIIQGYFTNLSLFPPSGGWVDGDTVYLSPTVAGGVTRTKPLAPQHLVYLGVVASTSPGAAGRMYVRVQNGYEMNELHDVQSTGAVNNDILYRDTTVTPNLWKPTQVSTLLGTTTVGNSLITLPNPSAVRYIKIKSDNTVEAISLATLKSELGLLRGVQTTNLTSALTTTTVNITGCQLALDANSTYIGRLVISTGYVSTNGFPLWFTFPAGATMNVGQISSTAVGGQVMQWQAVTSGIGLTNRLNQANAQIGFTAIDIIISTGSTSGNLTPVFSTFANGTTATVYGTATFIQLEKI